LIWRTAGGFAAPLFDIADACGRRRAADSAHVELIGRTLLARAVAQLGDVALLRHGSALVPLVVHLVFGTVFAVARTHFFAVTHVFCASTDNSLPRNKPK
jgi:hypothetical protein